MGFVGNVHPYILLHYVFVFTIRLRLFKVIVNINIVIVLLMPEISEQPIAHKAFVENIDFAPLLQIPDLDPNRLREISFIDLSRTLQGIVTSLRRENPADASQDKTPSHNK